MPAHLSSRTGRAVKSRSSRGRVCASMDCARAFATARSRLRDRGAASRRASLAQQPPLTDNRLFQSGIEITSITATVIDKEGHPGHRPGARGVRGLRGRRPPDGHAVHARAGADRARRAARHQRQHVRQADGRCARRGRHVPVRAARPGRRVLPDGVQPPPAAADRLDARAGRRAARARRAAAVGRHRDLRRDPRGAADDREAHARSGRRSW